MNEWRAKKGVQAEYRPMWSGPSKHETQEILDRVQTSCVVEYWEKWLRDLNEHPEVRFRVSPYQARDLYLVNWFKWGVSRKGPSPAYEAKYTEPGVDSKEQQQRLVTGQRLLETYDPLIAYLASHPTLNEEDGWDQAIKTLVEPNAAVSTFPNRNPLVLQRELYAELQTFLLSRALAYQPTRGVFSTYVKSALSWCAKRYVAREVRGYGLGVRTARLVDDLEDADEDLTESVRLGLAVPSDDLPELCTWAVYEGAPLAAPSGLSPEVEGLIRSRLTKRQWDVFELVFLDQMGPVKAAEVLGVTHPLVCKTTKAIVRRLSSGEFGKKLKKFLEHDQNGYGTQDIIY